MTFREAYNLLPEFCRDKAIANYLSEEQQQGIDDELDERATINDLLVSSIYSGFILSGTPEGREYWEKVIRIVSQENYNV